MKVKLALSTTLLLLLLSTLTLAEETNTSKNVSERIKEDIKNVTTNVKDSTTSILEKPIELSEGTRSLMEIFLGIEKDRPVPLKLLIIMGAFWIILFLITYNVFKALPFLNEKWQYFIAALVLMMLLSTLGTINEAVTFWFSWVEWLGSTVLAIIITAIILWGGKILMQRLGYNSKLHKARSQGEAIAMLGAKAKAEAEASKRYN